MSNNNTIWGIHAGRTGDADTLFLSQNIIALGWDKLADLSKLKLDRDAFKKAVKEEYPNKRPMAIANNAGQLLRFIHEMQNGDYVIYTSKKDRKVHLGKVIGNYLYKENDEGYPHTRKVEWIKEFSRTIFSQGALYEIGSAMSFFQVKNFADEFIEALSGEKPEIDDDDDDETIAIVSENIEETTNIFILKALTKELKGHPFAELVGHLLNKMGYNTRVSPPGPDKGVDIIAHKDELGFEPPIIKVQVKSSESSIGAPDIQRLYGTVSSKEFGLFISLGDFTNQAKNFASQKSNLRLIDSEEFMNLILRYYDKLDSKYKGIIPLKKVFIPQETDIE